MKKIKIILIIGVVGIMLASCAVNTGNNQSNMSDYYKASNASSSPKAAKERKDTAIIALSEGSGTYNPILSSNETDMHINSLIFESLFETDEKGDIIPSLADYKISEDNKKYTFTLKDASFSNGEKVGAKDVYFTLKVIADGAYYGFYNIYSLKLVGLEEYQNGKKADISGVKIIDEKTIEINLQEPNSATLSFFTFGILSEKYYSPSYKMGDFTGLEALFKKPIGCGQYKLLENADKGTVKLAANENYFKGAPKIKNVIFTTSTLKEEMGKIELGEADITYMPATADYIKRGKAAKFISMYKYPANSFGNLGFNCLDSVLKDYRVRQAFAYVANRQAVLKNVFGEYGSLINIPDTKASWAYTTNNIQPYNVDLKKAEALLDEAGYPKKADGKRFSVKIFAETPNEYTDVFLPVFKDDLSKIGIDLVIENMDFATIVDKIYKGEARIYFLALSLTAEPNDIGSLFETFGSVNLYSYSNKQIDELYAKARKAMDKQERKGYYAEIYQILNKELPCIPLYQRDDLWAVNGRLQNFSASSFRSPFEDFYKIQIK